MIAARNNCGHCTFQGDEFKAAIGNFYKLWCKLVRPGFGAKAHGRKYGKLPLHKLVAHTESNIRWLWDNFGALMGQVCLANGQHGMISLLGEQ